MKRTKLKRSEILRRIEKILSGIDSTETQALDGWWETSKGAAFGATKLAKIRELFEVTKNQ